MGANVRESACFSLVASRTFPQRRSTRADSASPRPLDPCRTMRALLSWETFRDVATLPTLEAGAFAASPAFDVKETKEAYEFKAESTNR